MQINKLFSEIPRKQLLFHKFTDKIFLLLKIQKKWATFHLKKSPIFLFPLLGRYRQEHPKRYTKQGRKQYPLLGREQEGDGVSGIPEEWDGLLEHKAPLCLPVDGSKTLGHRYGGNQRLERTAISSDMCICNLMESHEDRGKYRVHSHRHRQCDP